MEHKDNPEALAPSELFGCKTIWELYQRTMKKFPNNQFLGTRNQAKEGAPYEWKTYREIYDLMDNFARGII